MADFTLRPATPDDLPAINAIIEAAIAGWDLPERVRRLALPSYRYDVLDLHHLTLLLAEDAAGRPLGVAAWEAAAAADCPHGRTGLLLHGLYVQPAAQRRGIGRALLQRALAAARAGGHAGLLVKARPEAAPFFERQGLRPLPASDHARHYAHRYWQDVPAD